MSSSTTALGTTNEAVARSSSAQWSLLLCGGVILFAALAAYHKSFAVPLLLDDVPSITRNSSIHQLWPIWSVLSPPVDAFVGGRPVVNFSFAANYALGGAVVWGYHAVNLAIHILGALTLFGIVRRTLLSPVLRGRFGTRATQLALAGAVLWTVHPLQTEAVTYISQRCESLMGLFYLLTLYCFIRGADAGESNRWFILSVAACFPGMACKEVMVTAPVMVLLYDRTFVSGSFREAWSRHRRLYLGLAGGWVLLGYLMVGLHFRGAGYGLGIPWWSYALIECRTVARYLWLGVWPHPLVFDYGEFVPVRQIGEVVPSALVLLTLAGSTLFALKRRPAIGFLGAWFFIILAPTSSVVPIVGQPMAEHRMYLPLASVVAGVVMGIYSLLGQRSLPVFLALAVGLGFLTIRRNEDYRTELSIWNDTVAKRPDNARAHSNLGGVLLEAGRFPEELEQREEALRIKPDDPIIHLNLANALARLGRLPEAVAQYEFALRINPNFARDQDNLAWLLARLGRFTEAVAHYEFALRINPDFARAQNNLAWLLATRAPAEGGDPVRAVARACKLSGDRVARYLDTLAAAYAAAGRFNDAKATAEKAIEVARAGNESSLAEKIEGRLQLYRNKHAYVQSADVLQGAPSQ
jgi:tetratricopeptide (TPR) repeat protein